MYDLPSSSTFGAPHHHMSSSSTSSLTGIGLGGPSTSTSAGASQNNYLTNLIINYLPQDLNERELHSVFSPMGPVETCRVMRDFKVSFLMLLIKLLACKDVHIKKKFSHTFSKYILHI